MESDFLEGQSFAASALLDKPAVTLGAIRKVLSETPEKFDPRDYLKPARDAMKKVNVARMTSLGHAGHASKIKPVTLGEMAKRYGT